MRMCALSSAIREKPNWWEKIKDPALVEKWKQEALDQQEGEYRIRQLTERMVTTADSFTLHNMGLTSFEDRLCVPRVAWVRVRPRS